MHGYYSTYVFMHNFAPTDVGVFLVKMCISQPFFYFALTDASALCEKNNNNNQEVFDRYKLMYFLGKSLTTGIPRKKHKIKMKAHLHETKP